MLRLILCILALGLPLGSVAQERIASVDTLAPALHQGEIPRTRWQHRSEASLWTLSALSALEKHGKPLTDSVPRDVDAWCPGYRSATPEARRAFWVGFLSALAKYESTWRPEAVGGGGKWFGLLQILPSTARLYGCRARSGDALKDGASNLSCAIRIMSVTVPRDGVIARGQGRWGGVAADWGPMRSAAKRTEMSAWLRNQSYCAVTKSPRPKDRTPAKQYDTRG